MSECFTVNCYKDGTEHVRITHEYESCLGEMQKIVLENDYCPDHADMWLRMDRDDIKYELITGTEHNEEDN